MYILILPGKREEMLPWYFGSVWTCGIKLPLGYLNGELKWGQGKDVYWASSTESVLKSGLHMKVGRRRKLKVKLGEMAKKTKRRETGIFGDQERDWLTIFWSTLY